MKRFTETNKWRDPWFRNLSSPAKMLWWYVCENCDAVGLIDLDVRLASTDCGLKITPSAVVEIASRLEHVGGSKFFIPQFIPFQYGSVSVSCPAHKSIIRLIEIHALENKGIAYHYPNSTLYPQGSEIQQQEYPKARVALPLKKGMDNTRMDTERKGEGGAHEFFDEFGNEIPETLRTAEFMSALSRWHAYKRERKEGYKSIGAKNLLPQLERLGGSSAGAIAAIEYSMGNNWAGVFPSTQPKPQSQMTEKERITDLARRNIIAI